MGLRWGIMGFMGIRRVSSNECARSVHTAQGRPLTRESLCNEGVFFS